MAGQTKVNILNSLRKGRLVMKINKKNLALFLSRYYIVINIPAMPLPLVHAHFGGFFMPERVEHDRLQQTAPFHHGTA